MMENPCEPCSHGFLSFRQQPIDELRIEGRRWFIAARYAGLAVGPDNLTYPHHFSEFLGILGGGKGSNGCPNFLLFSTEREE